MKEKYYIGDLCYILPNDAYDAIVCSWQYDGSGWKKWKKYEFCYQSTAYGDGIYDDNFGNEYTVDSGTIGILRLKGTGLVKKAEQLAKDNVAAVVQFETQPPVFAENGLFEFGDVVIDTRIDEEDRENVW